MKSNGVKDGWNKMCGKGRFKVLMERKAGKDECKG